MRKTILSFMLLIPVVLLGQTEGIALEEVEVIPDFVYGENSLFIKGNTDGTFRYSILDMENNHDILTGKLKTLEPMNRTGRYMFYTPDGDPYASGYYSNNIPFRSWSFFDKEGKVIQSLNYSGAIQFLNNFGSVDLGGDSITSLNKVPGYRKKDIKGLLSHMNENAVYPPFSLINNEQGKVLCQFVIDKSGKLVNLKLLEGENEDLDLEVIRLLSLAPPWKPLKIKGDPVNAVYTIPILFTIPGLPSIGEETETEPDSQ
jgi:TonB family protein